MMSKSLSKRWYRALVSERLRERKKRKLPANSFATSSLKHLKTIGTWASTWKESMQRIAVKTEPLHYVAISTQLELSKICKSKGLVFAQFSPKSDNSTFDWWKTLKNLLKKYSNQIFTKNVIFIGKKSVAGVWQSAIFVFCI